jgi:UDP-N-acetylmuramate--alanine ligase
VPAARPLTGERFHLIGVAGRGMAPLAAVARHLGAEVSGCDRAPLADTAAWLEDHGLEFAREHSVDHLDPGGTVVATSVADPVEPEVAAARDRLWHRSDLLAHVLRQRMSIGVTGSHGKGTVAALTTAALRAAGHDPTSLLGLSAPELGGFARFGAGPIVAEVDDSDNSLARVDTDVAVVTTLDADHPHLPISLQQSVAGVGEYVGRARRRVILGASPRAGALEAHARAEVWRYGRELHGRVRERRGSQTFLELRAPGIRVDAELRTLVVEPQMNAALAWAGAISAGADPEAAAAGLAEVTVLTRRMELVGERDGVVVVDDLGAKHPAAIRAAIATVRRHYPAGRVVAVFEPCDLFVAPWGNRYARALSGADEVVLLPEWGNSDYASAPDHDRAWMAPCRAPVRTVADHEAAAAVAMAAARPGDAVLFLSHRSASRWLARYAVTGERP